MANGGDTVGIARPSVGPGAIAETPVAVAGSPHIATVARRGQSPAAESWRRLSRNRTALVGLAIVLLLLAVAAGADLLAPHSPIVSDQTQTFQPPSWAHPLGTDQLGRDMLSRVLHGSRISLAVGTSSVLLALLLGVPLGMLAGFYGGRIDGLVMRLMDLVLAFPIYLLAIIIMVIFTPTAGLLGTIKVVGAIAIVRVPIYARLMRGSVLSIKEKEYVEAGRALGLRDPSILLRHHRHHDARSRHGHHRRGDAVVPGSRNPAADTELGMGSEGERGLHPDDALACGLPRYRDLPDRAGVQSLRRRASRCPRSTTQVMTRAQAKIRSPHGVASATCA
jgi:ABC-type amino acid transport system permease subunit